MASRSERAAFAARLMAFGASEVRYVSELRNQMTEDFVSFVRGSKDEATRKQGTRLMTMSLQKNDLASQVDQHILSLLDFASELMREGDPSDDRTIDELVQEVAASWTLGDFRERFSKAFNIPLGTARIGSLRAKDRENIELF